MSVTEYIRIHITKAVTSSAGICLNEDIRFCPHLLGILNNSKELGPKNVVRTKVIVNCKYLHYMKHENPAITGVVLSWRVVGRA